MPSSSQKKLKLYTLYTDSHEQLLNKFFLPSLQNTDVELIAVKYEQLDSGQYLTIGFQKTLLKKVNLIVDIIEKNFGETFIYSDVDVQFFGAISENLLSFLKNKDCIFQADVTDSKILCAGFFISVANESTLILWKEVRSRLEATIQDGNSVDHDQDALNKILKQNPTMVKWGFLPIDAYYCPRQHYAYPADLLIPKSILVHHANWASGTKRKQAQLEYVRKAVQKREFVSRYRFFIHYLKNRIEIYHEVKIGQVGIFLKKHFPAVYRYLKSFQGQTQFSAKE